MAKATGKDSERLQKNIIRDKHYKDLKRNEFIRLSFTYILPLVILIAFFQYQFHTLLSESRSSHMKTIAENQANILDLFLRERVVNLLNLIDDPDTELPPSEEIIKSSLNQLRLNSDTYIDLGFFDNSGIQLSYAGPIAVLENKDYGNESWYINLKKAEGRFIITDIYSGFRDKPHFTIAVNKRKDNHYFLLKSSLDPEKIYDNMTSTEQAEDVEISIINRKGIYQLVDNNEGRNFDSLSIVPPTTSKIGISNINIDNDDIVYAYTWLSEVDWAVIIWRKDTNDSIWSSQFNMILFSSVVMGLLFWMISVRSKKIAQMQIEKDITRSQLEHASKLASVGELAGGIAHEINNPLAIIASEVGLILDMMNPKYKMDTEFKDIVPHLNSIHDSAFRCRDITRKLLSFVRQDEIKLKEFDINDAIRNIIESFFEMELSVSNIDIELDLNEDIPLITTDINQFNQVLLNIINNAVDAITPPGQIHINSSYFDQFISIDITDTGKGIKEEHINLIFNPFFTTKEVGKGTGLGLSISFGIIKNLGGNIEVESIYTKGTTFTIKVPVEMS